MAISHWNDSGNFDTGVRIVDVSGDGLPDSNCIDWLLFQQMRPLV
jgi:hypothetical protein